MNFTDFQADLLGYPEEDIVFVGLGNRMRGDDAAGLELLDMIKKSGFFTGSTFISAGTNPENYLQQILAAQPKLVVFLDACDFRDRPGEIRWLDYDEIEKAGISTHAYSMTMIERYLNLERTTECRYLAIQPGFLDEENGLSSETRQGLLRFLD